MSLLAAMMCGAADAKLYVDDVFSTYLYTGNGATQTITNGIDLAGKGGMVWIKSRSNNVAHNLFDTIRGTNKALLTHVTDAESTTTNRLNSFSSSGFAIGDDGFVNYNAATYASWTFRRAPKFFDVVTFTTNASGIGTFNHALGDVPGTVIFKRTDNTEGWFVYHRSLSTTSNYLMLNSTNAQANMGGAWYSATSSTVTTGLSAGTPFAASGTYVAYLFAHDPSPNGLIQCGSFTSAVGVESVSLGFEPQYLIYKRVSGSTPTSSWHVADNMRGVPTGSASSLISADTSAAEATGLNITFTSTGFAMDIGSTGDVWVYLAIRRPNKPPTTGTQVYNVIARTGTGSAVAVTGVGFAPDLAIIKEREYPYGWDATDRMRGANGQLEFNSTSVETTYSDRVTGLDIMDGIKLGAGQGNYTLTNINHFFRRATGFFDVVCYMGTGVARTVPHNLQAVPELMIVRNRTNAGSNWVAYHKAIGNTKAAYLNSASTGDVAAGFWNNTSPSATVFTVGTASDTNGAQPIVAYLFATCQGVSKVGSYTGNGSSLNIDCGFSAGARFVLIKRTDSTGDWYVWDTARGIIAANDPHLSMNSSAAEVTTDDSIDPYSTGFTVNQNTATNINVNAATYIFLAIS